jgi:LuxR family maltose regulon positive regulatory protein
MLEKLERMTLLMVPLDDRRCWYRYHHLFSGFLRERLHRENREAVSELHRRAIEWHEGNGTDNEAIGHALAARDFARAADVIERLRDAMVGRGEIFPLARLMMPLPEEVLRIAGFMATGRSNIAWEGRAGLPRAIALNRRALALLAHDQQGPTRGIAAGNLAECLLDIGDLGAASRAMDEAIEISHTAGHRAQIGASLCLLERLQTTRGQLSEATKTYERVLQLTDEHDEGGTAREIGEAHVSIGELLFEWNNLEGVTRHLLEGIERALDWSPIGEVTSRLLELTGTQNRPGRLEEVDADTSHSVVTGYITLARVSQAQGGAEGALEALHKVRQVA